MEVTLPGGAKFTPQIENALSIQGWMTEFELAWLATTAAMSKNIIEIGSWQGRSTRAIADNTSGSIIAVDHWQGSTSEVGENYATQEDASIAETAFQFNLIDHIESGKLSILKSDSLHAAFDLSSNQFDFIFIDASHTYHDVCRDLKAWWPLVSQGGIISGHDYSYIWPGVVQAVNELFPNHMMCAETIWAARKQ